MNYATAVAFRTSLETRLRTAAGERGNPRLVRLRKLVVFDRILARLQAVASDRWVVKGGVALIYRFDEQARTTRDRDLAGNADADVATEDLVAMQDVDLGDYFAFAVQEALVIDVGDQGAAVRYRVSSTLDGRRFEEVIIDIGFDNTLTTRADRLRGPGLLRFANIEPIEVPTLPIGQHIAEKVHAYTRTYSGGRENTRVKDLVDLVMISSIASCDANDLRDALLRTFRSRAIHELPTTLRAPTATWESGYRRTSKWDTGSQLSSSIQSFQGKARTTPAGTATPVHGNNPLSILPL